MRSLLVAAALTTGAFLVGSGAAKADTTVTVNPASIGSNWFTADTRAPGAGAFRYGPSTAPLGSGSFELSTPLNSSKAQLFTNLYNGMPISQIDGIGYSTFQGPSFPATTVAMVAINMRVALDGGATPNAYLVYEPYVDEGNGALQKGVWQNWDAYKGGNAKWWISVAATSCGQQATCTWNQLKTLYPNATIREAADCGNATFPNPTCPGSLGLNQGSGNDGAISSADALYVSTPAGGKTTYNLEPTADTTKPSCGSMVVRRNPGGHDEADVTVSDSGSGIASITNFTVTNGTANIPPFTLGAPSVTVTAIKGDQGASTRFEFDVTDQAGNTTHCV